MEVWSGMSAGERDAGLPSTAEGHPSWGGGGVTAQGVTAQGVTTCFVPELQCYQRDSDTKQC